MRTHWSHVLSAAALTLAMVQSVTLADRFNIEDPSQYPGVWYRIEFDSTGDMTSGTGDGQGWYYYPASGVYRMWWHNGAYDTSREGHLAYEVYAEAIDPDLMTHASIRFIWTSAGWSQSGHSNLPLPTDVSTVEEEDAAISSSSLMTIDYYLGDASSSEANRSNVIRDYNPEWVGIEIAGRNLHVCRGAFHECRAKSEDTPSLGAWCDRSTGACYLGTEDEGLLPYEWLGAGSSCASCRQTTGADQDFGDAPDPMYPTLLAHNGARHTIVRDLFLGRGVDAEADGQPNADAEGDDRNGDDEDGVSFTSVLQPGIGASVEVTASARGYLNAWVDFDHDGSFGGRGEQIFADELLIGGTNRLTFSVPMEAVPGTTYARFRFNSRGLLSYDGPASDGEVEEYPVPIARSYEPHATSGLTSVVWSQLPAGPSTAAPYAFESGSEPSALHLRQIAADDWQTSDARPITGVHWWGAFDGWTESYLPVEMPLAFHIGIWTNMPSPASAKSGTFAHPDTLIWENYCTDWTWALAGFERGNRDELGQTCFQFTCSLSQDQWFEANQAAYPKGDIQPTTYWLSITAVYDPEITRPAHLWAWKTRPGGSTAAAVSIRALAPSTSASWPPAAGAQWQEGQPLQDQASRPLDLAFQLTTYAPAEYGSPAPGQPKIGAATGLDDLPRLAAHWLADAR